MSILYFCFAAFFFLRSRHFWACPNLPTISFTLFQQAKADMTTRYTQKCQACLHHIDQLIVATIYKQHVQQGCQIRSKLHNQACSRQVSLSNHCERKKKLKVEKVPVMKLNLHTGGREVKQHSCFYHTPQTHTTGFIPKPRLPPSPGLTTWIKRKLWFHTRPLKSTKT